LESFWSAILIFTFIQGLLASWFKFATTEFATVLSAEEKNSHNVFFGLLHCSLGETTLANLRMKKEKQHRELACLKNGGV